MATGSTEYALPFQRGSTYKDGSTLTLTSSTGEAIVGRVYKTVDSDGKDLWLRAVRADAALTDIGGNCVEYTAGYTGTNVAAISDTAGAVCSPVDDAYASTFDVAQYDIFYVVERGYCDLLPESDVDAGDAVSCYTNGNVKQTTAGQYVVGIAQESYSDATTNVKVFVTGNLTPSDPAS